MRYYPIVRNWSRKIKPHLQDPEFNRLLVRDFNKYTMGRWRKPFLPGMTPTEFEFLRLAMRSSGQAARVLGLRQARGLPLARERQQASGDVG